jgi:hypothetical protein
MCECYQIGGPWITYDPDCPAHGTEARARDEQQTDDRLESARLLAEYKAEVVMLRQELAELKERCRGIPS